MFRRRAKREEVAHRAKRQEFSLKTCKNNKRQETTVESSSDFSPFKDPVQNKTSIINTCVFSDIDSVTYEGFNGEATGLSV